MTIIRLRPYHRRYQNGVVALLTGKTSVPAKIGMKPHIHCVSKLMNVHFSSMVTADVTSREFLRDWKAPSPILTTPTNRFTKDFLVTADSTNDQIIMNDPLMMKMMTNRTPLHLSDMIEQIPLCIQLRKRLNVSPGCTKRDPVLQLMRYVIRRCAVLLSSPKL
jgi:hypothetical protein